jgi:hypothetical protein
MPRRTASPAGSGGLEEALFCVGAGDGYGGMVRPSRPALLVAGGATVAVSGITDVRFVWLLWPLVWIARPWGRRRETRPNTTVAT